LNSWCYKISYFCAKEYEDEEGLSCLLEEIFVIERFVLYYVGTEYPAVLGSEHKRKIIHV